MTRITFLLGMVCLAVALILPAAGAGQGDTASAPTLQVARADLPGRGYPYCVQFDSDTAYHEIDCPDAATPTPTDTPPPTATMIPTNTPRPTVTPSPTPTATETPEPTQPPASATPTQELTPPPPTFTHTPVPTKTCELKADRNINVRIDHALNNTPLRVWFQSETSTFKAFYEDVTLNFLWGQHLDGGWSVVAVRSPLDWWVDGTADAQFCFDVDGWPGWVPPEPIAHNAALLWHTVPGFNIGNARISHAILKDKGIAFGYKTYSSMWACLETLNNGGICEYRHPNADYPQNIGGSDPRQSARDFFDTYGRSVCNTLRGYDNAYYEPTNEANFGSTQSDAALSIIYWWRDWMDTYLTEALNYGCPKLILPTFGPGHGEPTQYRIWKDVLNRLAESGGLMGEHIYQPYPNSAGTLDLMPCDVYLSCRHRLNQVYRQQEGVDIDVALTEVGPGWGDEPVNVSDFLAWYNEVRGDEWVHSVSLWVLGYHPTWPRANLDNYVVDIANGVGRLQ